MTCLLQTVKIFLLNRITSKALPRREPHFFFFSNVGFGLGLAFFYV